MGYQASDDDPEEPARSNGHDSETPPEESAPEANNANRSQDEDLPPRPGLGLPADYDPQVIPTFSELRAVADRRLDWETAFMILNHDDPDLIVARLDEMAEMIRAAISVQGPNLGNPDRYPSLKKAVRLGLALSLKYWLRANKFDAWLDLISPLLTTAIQMEEFQAAVFRHWSFYHSVGGKLAPARAALEASQDYATESGRPDLALLAQAHRFDLDVSKMDLDEADEQAKRLIDRAQDLGYDYVRGQVYVSLARAYSEQLQDGKKVFEYSQQALVILLHDDEVEVASDALTLMLGIIGMRDDHSLAYREALRAYFECLVEKSVNPIFQAAAYFFQGRGRFYQDQYDEAMLPLLNAWRKYRQMYLPMNVTRTLHMLGLVQTKRQKWAAAEFYLGKALERYRTMEHKGYEIHTLHARAFIPYEYEHWTLALSRLEEALAMALQHPDAVPQAVIDEIKKDITEVKKKLRDGDEA